MIDHWEATRRNVSDAALNARLIGKLQKFRPAKGFLMAVGLACGLSLSANAQTPSYSATPVFGGNGGGAFVHYCPNGTYIIGISGRTGDWIDAIQPICARWNSGPEAFGPPVKGSTAGGSGGGPATLMCPAGMVVRGWEIAKVQAGDAVVVKYVRPQCESVVRGGGSIPGRFGGDGDAAPSDRMGYKCPEGQFANGIYGTSGAFVDRAGLWCEAPSGPLGRPVPYQEPAKSIGRVGGSTAPPGPPRSICESARDARARNSPAAPYLEVQCRASGQVSPSPQVGIYDSPTVVVASESVRLDFCRDYGSACGKPAADAFCRQRGHPDAARFEIAKNIGRTVIISSGAFCVNAVCDGFATIHCNPARQGVTYDSPAVLVGGQTVRLDFCRDYGSACGKLAADAFCRQQGHPDAARFEISKNVGRTVIISSGAFCVNAVCDGFSKIQCNPDPR